MTSETVDTTIEKGYYYHGPTTTDFSGAGWGFMVVLPATASVLTQIDFGNKGMKQRYTGGGTSSWLPWTDTYGKTSLSELASALGGSNNYIVSSDSDLNNLNTGRYFCIATGVSISFLSSDFGEYFWLDVIKNESGQIRQTYTNLDGNTLITRVYRSNTWQTPYKVTGTAVA